MHWDPGVESCPYHRFFANGNSWWKGAYLNGRKDETWHHCNHDGRLRAVEDYEEGMAAGVWPKRVCQDGWIEHCKWEKSRR